MIIFLPLIRIFSLAPLNSTFGQLVQHPLIFLRVSEGNQLFSQGASSTKTSPKGKGLSKTTKAHACTATYETRCVKVQVTDRVADKTKRGVEEVSWTTSGHLHTHDVPLTDQMKNNWFWVWSNCSMMSSNGISVNSQHVGQICLPLRRCSHSSVLRAGCSLTQSYGVTILQLLAELTSHTLQQSHSFRSTEKTGLIQGLCWMSESPRLSEGGLL